MAKAVLFKSMEINFRNKTILITGAASGAGEKILDVFAKTHADIAFTYLHSDPKKIIERYPDLKIKGYHFDQKDVSSIPELIKKIMNDFSLIDVLVNNAGIYPASSFQKITEDDFDEMMDTNNKGIFFLSREVSKYMKQGSIINISSINATNPSSKLIHYGISKAAVEMQTKCLAYELGPEIRVNCIAPGLIYKEGQEKFIPGWRESYNERAALKRTVLPEEIGKACLFFASDLSSAITGQILTVDCGVSLAPYYYNELDD